IKCKDYYYYDLTGRLARSTLVLIPLLGIHELVFIFLMDEHVEGLLRHIRLFLQLVISSFQGFLVAVLYCFTNGEVQAELKMRWRCWLMVNHSECGGCLLGKHFKQLGRRPKQRGGKGIVLYALTLLLSSRRDKFSQGRNTARLETGVKPVQPGSVGSTLTSESEGCGFSIHDGTWNPYGPG
uniref:Glucagon like peptide 2 receptor n=1 Tax=Callorhinchus milii TaxID=7868 RepID=A0A4W3GSE2_CALMI